MASARKVQFSVGLLVVVLLALLTGFILFLTQNRLTSTDTVFETYIRESVQGLEVGSTVRYRGVAVGRVTSIGLASAVYRRPQGEGFASAFQLVVVTFALDLNRVGDIPSTEDAVSQGLRARLAAQGITGVAYIELDFVDPDRYLIPPVPWTARFPTIPAVPSTVAQVQSAAEMVMRQLQDIDIAGLFNNVAGLVSDLRTELQGAGLAAVSTEAADLLRDLRGIAGSADVPGLMEELRATSGSFRGLAESREVREALAAFAAAAQDLRRTTARLPATLGQVDATLRSARGTTTDVQAELAPLLRDLRAIVANLRETSEALRRSPSQAILGAPPPAGARR